MSKRYRLTRIRETQLPGDLSYEEALELQKIFSKGLIEHPEVQERVVIQEQDKEIQELGAIDLLKGL